MVEAPIGCVVLTLRRAALSTAFIEPYHYGVETTKLAWSAYVKS